MDLWEVYVQLSLCSWKFKCCHNKIVKEAKKKKKNHREKKGRKKERGREKGGERNEETLPMQCISQSVETTVMCR